MLTINWKQIYEFNLNDNEQWILILYDISQNHYVGVPIYNEEKEDEKDRALFSQLFKIFSDYQADKIQLDATSYQAFIEKSKRVSSKKGADQVTAELLEYIRSRIPEGSSIDLEYIKKILEKKED